MWQRPTRQPQCAAAAACAAGCMLCPLLPLLASNLCRGTDRGTYFPSARRGPAPTSLGRPTRVTAACHGRERGAAHCTHRGCRFASDLKFVCWSLLDPPPATLPAATAAAGPTVDASTALLNA